MNLNPSSLYFLQIGDARLIRVFAACAGCWKSGLRRGVWAGARASSRRPRGSADGSGVPPLQGAGVEAPQPAVLKARTVLQVCVLDPVCCTPVRAHDSSTPLGQTSSRRSCLRGGRSGQVGDMFVCRASEVGLQKPSFNLKYTMLFAAPTRATSTVLVAGMPQPSSMLLVPPSTELRSPIPYVDTD